MRDWSLQTPVKRVQENLLGRDFVVGDVHGCFRLLETSLQSVNFDPQVDRLFSVGDLIDRGADSARLLQLLTESWFFACLGNHESILLDFVSSPESELATNWKKFGGNWFLQLSRAEQADIASSICQHCSFAIVIEQDNHPQTAIVHADIPQDMNWSEFSQLVSRDKVTQYECLWSRARGQGKRDDIIEGVERVVTGHQIVAEAYQSGNVWLLDTGAYRSNDGLGALTVLELPATLHRFTA